MRFMIVLSVAVGLAACTGAPEPPAPYDAVGTYLFETSIEGQPVTGTMRVERGPDGAYRGIVTPDWGQPPMPIRSVLVTDTTVTINADADGEALVVVMTFAEGGTFTAYWTVGDQGGEATVRKVESGR